MAGAETIQAVACSLFFVGLFAGSMLMICILKWDRNTGDTIKDDEPWRKK